MCYTNPKFTLLLYSLSVKQSHNLRIQLFCASVSSDLKALYKSVIIIIIIIIILVGLWWHKLVSLLWKLLLLQTTVMHCLFNATTCYHAVKTWKQKFKILIKRSVFLVILIRNILTLWTPKAIFVPHRIIWSWYTGRWWIGCYIWYSEEGPGWAAVPPSPLLAVQNVTAHPSTASVPITALLYDGPLLCSFNGLHRQHPASPVHILAQSQEPCGSWRTCCRTAHYRSGHAAPSGHSSQRCSPARCHLWRCQHSNKVITTAEVSK